MHHLLLAVSDLPRSVQFYRDALGMQVDYCTANFAMLRVENFGVALSTHPLDFEIKGEPKGIGMIPHFTTSNMDEFAARLKEIGVPWLRAPVRESFGIEAFIKDPDGYQWAVLAPLTIALKLTPMTTLCVLSGQQEIFFRAVIDCRVAFNS